MTDRKPTSLSQRKQLSISATSSKIMEDTAGKKKRPGKVGNLILIRIENQQVQGKETHCLTSSEHRSDRHCELKGTNYVLKELAV